MGAMEVEEDLAAAVNLEAAEEVVAGAESATNGKQEPVTEEIAAGSPIPMMAVRGAMAAEIKEEDMEADGIRDTEAAVAAAAAAAILVAACATTGKIVELVHSAIDVGFPMRVPPAQVAAAAAVAAVAAEAVAAMYVIAGKTATVLMETNAVMNTQMSQPRPGTKQSYVPPSLFHFCHSSRCCE